MPPLPAGIMPDYRCVLPEFLKQYTGKWVWHEALAPGILRHVAADGTECLSVRVPLPPGGYLSAGTLRLLARWVREYAQVGRRTSRQAFELVGVSRERLPELLAEIDRHGFVVGGTGNALHQLKGCNGFVHCQNAAVDPPSIIKALGDALCADMVSWRYPAPLKISVSGCPNHCGGAVEGDIGIAGVYLDPPNVDHQRLAAASPDFTLLCRMCPVSVVKVRSLPTGKSVVINRDRCIRCSSCAMVAPEGITMGPRRGVAITVGGHGPGRGGPPQLGRVIIPYLPARPPAYAEVVAAVQAAIAAWVNGARAGERIGNYVNRVGWQRFLDQIRAAAP